MDALEQAHEIAMENGFELVEENPGYWKAYHTIRVGDRIVACWASYDGRDPLAVAKSAVNAKCYRSYRYTPK